MLVAALVSMLETSTALTGAGCAMLEQAHENFVNSCFSAERHLEGRLNERPFLREHVGLQYHQGELTLQTKSREVLKKGMQIDSEAGDMALELTFDCERIAPEENGLYGLTSAEDPERVIFQLDEQQPLLQPLRYEFATAERFLFMKYEIILEVEYRDLRFEPCDEDSAAKGP